MQNETDRRVAAGAIGLANDAAQCRRIAHRLQHMFHAFYERNTSRKAITTLGVSPQATGPEERACALAAFHATIVTFFRRRVAIPQ